MWNKKKKIVYLLYCLTAKWLPESRQSVLAKKIRRYFARKIVVRLGKEVNVERGARFDAGLSIGNNSGIGINCELYGPITIGNDVMMGPEVVIYTQNHKHETGDVFWKQGFEEKKPVIIGDNVWIGRRVMIMPGCTIGDNSVIAAGAVVTSSFENNVILGGVPAKVIGTIEE